MAEVRRASNGYSEISGPTTQRRINVVAPGPSLIRSKIERNLTTIGVNGAVQAVECDWWAFIDRLCLQVFDPIGTPRLSTRASALLPAGKKSARRLLQDTPETVTHQKLIKLNPELRATCKSWSLGLALTLAEHLEAEIIYVHGADFSGDNYCYDLKSDKATQDGPIANRWEVEGERFRDTQRDFWDNYSISIRRVTPL